ncbi:hypothetical protein [Flavobacterium algicola]|uniref:hypothetical protein n=1 Tax=Flavobacterium algicola TaxID=556529 RepID=UPI001EFD2941|nr:hypothetical protein [Flavobacterium algicola]MCG9792150.1 hypothetical protein [Flavobacterium algicola]
MKIISNKHYLLIAFFAGTVCMIAQPPAPIPVIPPPGLPIDEGLIALLIGGILFGTYTIYNFNKKRKPLN